MKVNRLDSIVDVDKECGLAELVPRLTRLFCDYFIDKSELIHKQLYKSSNEPMELRKQFIEYLRTKGYKVLHNEHPIVSRCRSFGISSVLDMYEWVMSEKKNLQCMPDSLNAVSDQECTFLPVVAIAANGIITLNDQLIQTQDK